MDYALSGHDLALRNVAGYMPEDRVQHFYGRHVTSGRL
jgi:hypothetical protein